MKAERAGRSLHSPLALRTRRAAFAPAVRARRSKATTHPTDVGSARSQPTLFGATRLGATLFGDDDAPTHEQSTDRDHTRANEAPQSAPDTRLDDLHTRLIAAFGQPAPRETWDPLTQLIYSLCSSRTKTPESHAVLRALRERYHGWPADPAISWSPVDWTRLRDAPVAEIEETIQLATFADRKAPQLKATLQGITQRTGALSLEFLAAYKTDKIRAWLEQFPGIGSQVSAAIVNFSSLHRRVLSVDGHHQRVSIRLGLAPAGATPRQVEHALMRIAPAGWTARTMDDHHQLVKTLGQRACIPHTPRCRLCPIREVCPTGGGTKLLGSATLT